MLKHYLLACNFFFFKPLQKSKQHHQDPTATSSALETILRHVKNNFSRAF